MKINLHLDYQTILANQARPVHFALEFTAGSLTAARPKPAAFCLVLDRSGSMSGSPLESAKQAAALAVRNLRPDDHFALVVFDDSARVLVPLSPAHDRDAIFHAIAQIKSGGSTNLTGGWMLGRDELKQAPTGASRRLLLLTDGQLNVGIIEPGQVCQIVAEGLESHSIRTSTLGFGDGYEEKLLAAIAKATGGEFYDAATPEKFPHIFTQELEGLQKVSIQNLRVRLQPLDFCDSFEQFGNYPAIRLPDGRHEIALGDLVSDEHRVLCFLLNVLPLPCVAGQPVASLEGEKLIDIEILYDEITAESVASRSHRQTVRIQATQDPAEVRLNETVVPWVSLQRTGRAFKTATAQFESRDQAAALQTLASAIAFLQQYGSPQNTAEALSLLRTLEERLQIGRLSERESKWAQSSEHISSQGSSRRRHNENCLDENQPPSVS